MSFNESKSMIKSHKMKLATLMVAFKWFRAFLFVFAAADAFFFLVLACPWCLTLQLYCTFLLVFGTNIFPSSATAMPLRW